MPVLQIAIYLSLLIFVAGIVIKTIRISRMPIHLRWDLYPIPHEKGKERYGGSRYEDSDWWTKPVQSSISGEIKEIAREIFGLKTLYRCNRGLWYFSLPFHLGLYALIGLFVLLAAGALLILWGVDFSADSASIFVKLIRALTVVVGALGWTLGIIGSLGLLLTRALRRNYREFSSVSNYFDLLLLLALFAAGLSAWLSADLSYEFLRAIVLDLISFNAIGELPALVKIELALAAIFLTYLPFTTMTHFVGKFFTYHQVRWQDKPNAPGSRIERDVIEALGNRVSWAAPHISTGKTWSEGAAERGEPGK
jgi:nitrate reductase gamma subunit